MKIHYTEKINVFLMFCSDPVVNSQSVVLLIFDIHYGCSTVHYCYDKNRSVNENDLLYINDDPEKYEWFNSTFLGLFFLKIADGTSFFFTGYC